MALLNLARSFCTTCAAAEGGISIELPREFSATTSHGPTTSRATVTNGGTTSMRSPTSLQAQSLHDSTTTASTASSTTDGSSFTYYVCDEPMISGTVTDWMQVRIPASVYDNWVSAMSTAVPPTVLQEASVNPTAFMAGLEKVLQAHHAPSWFKAMPTAAQSVFVSFWLPQYDPSHAITTGLAPSSEYTKYFPTSYQASLLYPDDTSTTNSGSGRTTSRKQIALGVSLPLIAVLVFCSIWYIIRLRARRRQQRDEEQPHSSSRRRRYKRDYNARPLFPHKPPARLSETSFTTDAGPSYGSMLKQTTDDNDKVDSIAVPNLPELQGSPTEETGLLPALASSDDDFGTHFSGLEDPFSDERHTRIAELPSPNPGTTPEPTIRTDMTPSVSPSSSPLRDRLGHESVRRRQAIAAVKGQASSGSGSWRGSVGEEELRKLGRAFESGRKEGRKAKGLRESKSVDDLAGTAATDKHDGLERSSSSRVTSWGEGAVGQAVEVIIRKLNRAK